MKLSGRDATRIFARPDPAHAGLLIHGDDAMRVALKRQEVVRALIGPEGEAEMRLTRINAADLRRDPAAVSDAMRAQGFFPGPRAALIEDVTDTTAAPVIAALKEWQAGDAVLIVTAGRLGAKSPLRKTFETLKNAFAAAIYDDPPTREEVDALLTAAGLRQIDPAAMADLITLSRSLDPGDFRQTVEKIGLYKRGDPAPLTPQDIALCAPATIEAAVDDVINAVAEAGVQAIGPLINRLSGQGVLPVSLCIQATRHFRTLHAAACDPGGVASGLARARPPVWGPRRDRMARQAQRWGAARLERALGDLVETDLRLRSSQRAPAMALMERTLIRIAMMAAR
ncbi:MAG: DNA polymerase III subunit delta [Rhodobacteraceae bacterium]|nr:DNA polymerase III subunit delta [Paracoccaceae bacterium]